MIVITFLNWVASLLYGTQLDMSSIVMSFDILTEAIGFIGYFIPMGPVVVIFTVLNLTYCSHLLIFENSLFHITGQMLPAFAWIVFRLSGFLSHRHSVFMVRII